MSEKKKTDEELAALLNATLPDWVRVDRCLHVNHRPHVPMVGTNTVSYASDRGGIINGDAPCGYRNCELRLDQHTSDYIAVIKIGRDTTSSELNNVLGMGSKFISLFDPHALDGVAMLEIKFQIVDDMSEEEKLNLVQKELAMRANKEVVEDDARKIAALGGPVSCPPVNYIAPGDRDPEQLKQYYCGHVKPAR